MGFRFTKSSEVNKLFVLRDFKIERKTGNGFLRNESTFSISTHIGGLSIGWCRKVEETIASLSYLLFIIWL